MLQINVYYQTTYEFRMYFSFIHTNVKVEIWITAIEKKRDYGHFVLQEITCKSWNHHVLNTVDVK